MQKTTVEERTTSTDADHPKGMKVDVNVQPK
jgi:hypothetical protein